MTIKEVSKKYAISEDTLRYYERVGMIPPVTRTESGLRDYSEEDLHWVALAKCMRGAGMPVGSLAEYIRLCQGGDETGQIRLRMLEEQRDTLLEQRRQMDDTLQRLDGKIRRLRETVNKKKETER